MFTKRNENKEEIDYIPLAALPAQRCFRGKDMITP
jgi:hypothetical protein